MLACKHCSTPNSLDSTFCKKCGTAVPADQKREATLQLDKLVEEGLSALAAGRTAEALAIADSAVATDPTHLGALHLKSAVHERRGEIADALESAERIVELNPDSELDRIKRNGLRTSLLNASTPVHSDRRVAFAAAAAAMVLVACAGIIVARRPAAPNFVANLPPTSGAVVDQPVATTPQQATEAPVAQNRVAQTMPNAVQPLGGPSAGTPDDRTPITAPNNPNLPRLPGANEPINPEGPGVETAPVNPSVKTPSVPKPRVDPDPPTMDAQAKPTEDPGTIEISVTKTGGKRAGGGTMIPETRTNGAAAYARIGTEQYELGSYASAATNLEKAVQSGGDAVELNRRLAQAYARLGRNSEAASAYERSRSAAEAALASGKGDRERLQAARDAADAGLKTVKGG